ncbi:MAG: hypothetical protein IPJ19_01145 [Planctomycetes bacterium]|nr:hypothetical protein [Planctomycetota bacterium]
MAELTALAQGGSSAEELAATAARAERALEEYLGFAPADLWSWQQLTALYEQYELAGRAQNATARALEFAPGDALLHARYARLSFALGGRERVLADYAAFARRHPEVALAAWYPALQHYEAGCEALAAEREGAAEFTAAQELFARAEALDASIQESCAQYAAACRVGLGWSKLVAGQGRAAEQEFRAAEALAPGTLARELPAGLASGLAGLARIARECADADSARAAALFEELHRLAPQEAGWANDAGLALRDDAVALERAGRSACTRGAGADAEHLLARARDEMERSLRAYQDAVALAPEDPGLLNDCALILVYHLQRDADEAERMLRHVLELAEAPLSGLAAAAAEEGLEPEQKSERSLAHQRQLTIVGDARQNLGVLYLTLRGDAKTALGYLESCRGMGPDPRTEVNQYLATAHAALEHGIDPRVDDATRWAAPCKDK